MIIMNCTAFYDASNGDSETSARMKLIRRANPYCGAFDEAFPILIECGAISVEDISSPHKIIIDSSRQRVPVSGKESELAQMAHNNYAEFINNQNLHKII